MKNNQKGFAPLVLLAIIAVIAIGSGGAYYYSKTEQPESIQDSTPNQTINKENDTKTDTSSTVSTSDTKKLLPSKPSSQLKSINLPFEGRTAVSLSVEERGQYLDALRKLDPETLFTLWKQFEVQKNDPQKKDFVGIALGNNLTEGSEGITAPVYKNISSFLSDGNNKIGSKSVLVGILGYTTTLPSLQILINVLNSQKDSELLNKTNISIVAVANKGWLHEEFSPILEEAYQKSSTVNNRATFAAALAKLGSPSGITILLRDAIREGQNVPNNIARYVLLEVRNPRAIPVLAKGLRDQKVDDFELIISGETLAAMSQEGTTRVIVDWAKNADSSVAPLVNSWLSKMRDTASIKLVKYTIENNETFKSDAVRNAVKDAFYYVTAN